MIIKINEDISVDTTEYPDETLQKQHAYYYQLGFKDAAQKFLDEIENRKNPVKPKKKDDKAESKDA